MKLRLNFFILMAVVVALFASCKSKNSPVNPNSHEVKVVEVLQTSAYTYLRFTENGKENWMAIEKQEVEKGGTYYYANPTPMTNFVSKELKRNFESILFVQEFSKQPIPVKQAVSPGSKKAAPDRKEIKVEAAEGGISIADLFSKRNSFSGKKVKIRGEVVKYNDGIMGKNWAHIQDGTMSDGEFDLTVTTMDEVKVGDVVVFEGSISLDKDFGAGYSYKVIMEDAKLLKK